MGYIYQVPMIAMGPYYGRGSRKNVAGEAGFFVLNLYICVNFCI